MLTASQGACTDSCPAAVLDGGPGDDVLHGGAGDDVLSGDGTGRNNPYVGDESETGPIDPERGEDVIDGGAGHDTARYARDEGVRVDLADGAPDGARGERDRLTGIEDVIGGNGPDVLLGDENANELTGGSGADDLIGRGGDDVLLDERVSASQDFLPLTEPDGADTLRGGAGDDVLDGGGEAGDLLSGGPGDDLLKSSDVMRARIVRCGTGSDRVDLAPYRQLLTGCERVVFSLVGMSVRPQRRPGGGQLFDWSCRGLRDFAGCVLKVTLRLGSTTIARRTLTLADGASASFIVRPNRRVRRGDVLDITVVGGLSKPAEILSFSGRWRVRA